MDGYTVGEAASVLGVSTERVWELLARGVLAGTPEGPSGMRVFLKPQPGPMAPREPDDGGSRPRGPNGHDGEMSPFRELLTEFRNLTERYGQALLALGEARGEVASLRGRVELLEARIDLRLPPPQAQPSRAAWDMPGPPAEEPATAAASPTSAASPTTESVAAVPPPQPDVAGVSSPPDLDELQALRTKRPPKAGKPAKRRARAKSETRRRAGLAEALARAEDPTPAGLPGGRDAADALAAFQDATPTPAAVQEVAERIASPPDEGLDEPQQPVPADELPVAEEPLAAAAVVAEPMVAEPMADEPHAAEPMPEEPLAAEPMPPDELPVAEEPLAAEPMAEEPLAAEPIAAEPMAEEPLAAEPIAADSMPEEPLAAEPMAAEELAQEPIPAEAAGEHAFELPPSETATVEPTVSWAEEAEAGAEPLEAVADLLESEAEPLPADSPYTGHLAEPEWFSEADLAAAGDQGYPVDTPTPPDWGWTSSAREAADEVQSVGQSEPEGAPFGETEVTEAPQPVAEAAEEAGDAAEQVAEAVEAVAERSETETEAAEEVAAAPEETAGIVETAPAALADELASPRDENWAQVEEPLEVRAASESMVPEAVAEPPGEKAEMLPAALPDEPAPPSDESWAYVEEPLEFQAMTEATMAEPLMEEADEPVAAGVPEEPMADVSVAEERFEASVEPSVPQPALAEPAEARAEAPEEMAGEAEVPPAALPDDLASPRDEFWAYVEEPREFQALTETTVPEPWKEADEPVAVEAPAESPMADEYVRDEPLEATAEPPMADASVPDGPPQATTERPIAPAAVADVPEPPRAESVAVQPATSGAEEEVMWLGDVDEAPEYAEEMEVATGAWREPAAEPSPTETAGTSSMPDDIYVEGWNAAAAAAPAEPAAAPAEPAAVPAEPPAGPGDPTAASGEPAPGGPTAPVSPRSPALDDRLAALDALARMAAARRPLQREPAAPAEPPLTGDEIVQRLRSQMAERRGAGLPRPASQPSPAPAPKSDSLRDQRSPAARAYRRLRRIFPG